MLGDFRIGEHLVRRELNRISGPAGEKTVELKALEVLVYLSRHPREVLSKERIIQAVWPDTFVTDDVLTHAISELRKAFDDDARQPRFIETIPRRGYRLIAPVVQLESETAPARPGRGRWNTWKVSAAVAAAAVIAGAYWISPLPDERHTVTTFFEPVPLTRYRGTEREPSFSPDGSQVAFTWDGGDGDNKDIYIKVIGTEEPRRLTMDPAIDASPAWSPDGGRIAFLRETVPGKSEVRLISPNGGPEHVLTTVLATPYDGLTWSPDGRVLAVSDRASLAEARQIVLVDLESAEKRAISHPPPESEFGDWSPAFSPDGRSVGFLRRGGIYSHEVWLVSPEGGDPRRLLTTTVAVGEGGAGESGTGLAWISSEEVVFNASRYFPDLTPRPEMYLWRVSITDGHAQRLVDTVDARQVAVARAGDRLVYSRDRSDLDIWRIDLLDTGKPAERFITSTALDANPQFSSDGRWIVFTSQRSGKNELWRADKDGTNLLQLTSVGAVGSPRWSPDSKEVVFDLAAEGNHDVHVVGSSGGPPRRITRDPANDVRPSWSRDGKWIYFGSNRSGEWQMWKVSAAGEEHGPARQITRRGGFAAIESFDGANLYYSRRRTIGLDSRNAIWKVPVEGGEEQPVIDRLDSSDTNWEVTAEGIFYVDKASASEAPWVVNFLRFRDATVTRVSQLQRIPFLSGPAFSVSPDGRWILSAQRQSGSDLMLVEDFR